MNEYKVSIPDAIKKGGDIIKALDKEQKLETAEQCFPFAAALLSAGLMVLHGWQIPDDKIAGLFDALSPEVKELVNLMIAKETTLKELNP